jgi:hypothetical protein
VPDLADWGGGLYFSQCRPKQGSPAARREANANKLWELSEQMIAYFIETTQQQIVEN